MRFAKTPLSPETCVEIVVCMAAYFGRLLYSHDFLLIVRDGGMGPDEFDALMQNYEFQPGYLLEHVLDENRFLEMMKPYLAMMIEKDIGIAPEIIWPAPKGEPHGS